MQFEPSGIMQKDSSRIKLGGDLAKAAGWPTDIRELTCYAYLRSAGELLCIAAKARTSSGSHPFQLLIDLLEAADDPEIPRLAAIPDPPVLALPYRFRAFPAVWVGKDLDQIDLKLGATYLAYLGWVGDERPPIYPIVRTQMIGLFSQARIDELRLQPLPNL